MIYKTIPERLDELWLEEKIIYVLCQIDRHLFRGNPEANLNTLIESIFPGESEEILEGMEKINDRVKRFLERGGEG